PCRLALPRCFYQSPSASRALPPFPTRRSSDLVKAAGAIVMSSATTVKEAIWLEENGADVIIAQGAEAGGHRGMFLTENIAEQPGDRKSTRLNSSHQIISYAVFCLKKKQSKESM